MDKISKRFVGFHTSFFSCIFNASFQLRFAYISSLVIAVFINRYGLDFELVIGESIKQQLCRTGFCRVFPGDAVSTLRVNAFCYLFGIPPNTIPFVQPYRPMSREYSRHIAENIAKGSSLCPFGSMTLGQPSPDDVTSSSADLEDFDPEALDSDDEPLSDLEW